MTKTQWKKRIKSMMQENGVYKSSFESVIDTLVNILEQRDKIYKQYVDEGSEAIIEKISDRGAVNKTKNPLLAAWMDLNTQALAYWRDLCLTPSALKKVNDDAMKKPKVSALSEALRAIG